ncbi:hypothetical protein [Methanobrevibacter millerae]|uniref:Uncharacterized protein n=1 Tax=Methanobrevibacter millerae TaxID=230361 RepID=A0A0U3E489_9EURY|nr:hypothetical protein [Methanobrevibacter millerae]ALT68823.1 hypothetical protein sm9_1034 [Methanobrevibacter millerae]
MQRNVSIALSIIIIILEIIALIVCYNSFGINLAYYTIDSNIFLLISTILYLLTINNVPKIVQLLKYSSTLSVFITFLVVVFVLYPMYNFNFQFLFLDGPNLYMHVLCPVLALISFIFFDSNEIENSLKNNLRSLYFTIIYAIILISLNILNVVSGPYPFLKVNQQSPLMSVFWIVLILGGALILSKVLLFLKDMNNILYNPK